MTRSAASDLPETSDSDTPLRPKYAVPAVEKALDVLEYLSEQGIPLTQAQLARGLGREPTEIFRLLGVLEARNYLRRENNGAYALTLKLFELSRTHSPHEHLLHVASGPMRELVERSRESCHLSVLHRDQVLVLAQVDSPKPIRLSVEAGSLHSAVDTISGQVLLAYSAQSEVDALLARRAEYLRLSAPQRQAFQTRLAQVRDDGYAYAEGLRYVGGCDLGVPVGTAKGGTRAALTIASLKGTEGHDDPLLLLALLRQCADDIARLAGIGEAGGTP